MMTQEEFMDVMAMKRQGLTIIEIAEETGYHPEHHQQLAARTAARPSADVLEAPAGDRRALGGPDRRAVAGRTASVGHQRLRDDRAEGYTGSYASVARHLNALRGPRFTAAPAASTRIETAPARSASSTGPTCRTGRGEWGLGEVQCFSAILSCSRGSDLVVRPSVDQEHTFEGLVRFFEAVGGVPQVVRTDRMGALGTSQGRRFTSTRRPTPSPSSTAPRSGPARPVTPSARARSNAPSVTSRSAFSKNARRPGPPKSLDELNERAARWLETASTPESTAAPEVPAERLVAEAPLLGALPRRRFDTAYVEARPGPRGHSPDRVARRALLGATTLSGPAGRSAPRGGLVRRIEVRWAGSDVATHPVGGRRGGRGLGCAHFASSPAGRPWRAAGDATRLVVPDDSRSPPWRSVAPTRHCGRRRGRRARPGPLWDRRGPIMTNSLYEQLKDDLGYLGLGRAGRVLRRPGRRGARTDELEPRRVPGRVMASRRRRRSTGAWRRRLRFARFPFRRSIEDFDFEFQPSVDRKLVVRPGHAALHRENRAVLFLGQPGCGKTHLAVALATTAVEAGYPRLLHDRRRHGPRPGPGPTRRHLCRAASRRLTAPTVLVIDDVGLLPIERGGAGRVLPRRQHPL